MGEKEKPRLDYADSRQAEISQGIEPRLSVVTLYNGGMEMKKHPFRYKVLVEFISPEERERIAHFTRVED